VGINYRYPGDCFVLTGCTVRPLFLHGGAVSPALVGLVGAHIVALLISCASLAFRQAKNVSDLSCSSGHSQYKTLS